MVGVAQLVERRVVVADVAGSSPVTHPNVKETDTGQQRETWWACRLIRILLALTVLTPRRPCGLAAASTSGCIPSTTRQS
jgi:hypothetical protein